MGDAVNDYAHTTTTVPNDTHLSVIYSGQVTASEDPPPISPFSLATAPAPHQQLAKPPSSPEYKSAPQSKMKAFAQRFIRTQLGRGLI